MALNFNTSPYYDDFDPSKNFHRILFKPGYAVQARELTQSQTILQHQVSKFADAIFQKNTPISGGKLTYNTKCYYIKLNPTINGSAIDVSLFENLLIKNNDGDVVAKVLQTAASVGSDPDTLVVSYVSGNKFQDGDTITVVDNPTITAQAIASASTGPSSVASISEGVFYVINGYNLSQTTNTKYSIGNFVNVLPQTTILSKYDPTPDVRVGLNITETIFDYVDDVSLLDPANGSPNYQGPGADRYVISLTLETRPLQLGDDSTFIELMRIKDGQILKQVDGTVYSTIDDYFAKRTFDTNGDYVVSDFALTPSANTSNSDQYDLKVGKGVAYVHGYRLENQSDISLTSNRARTTDSIDNNATFIDYGNYLYVDNANGVFDITTMPSVDLHVVDKTNIAVANTTTYNATLAATAYIRGLEFDHLSDINDSSTFVYRAYLTDIQNKTLSANVVSSGTSNITLPGLGFSSTSNAYYNVTVSIDNGPSAGDVKRIVSYDGSTRNATVDSPWTVTPTTDSVFTLRFDVKDIESMVRVSSGTTIAAWSSINEASGKDNGLSTGSTILENKTSSELIYNIGYPFVADISSGVYETTQVFRGVSFNGSSPTQTPTITFDNSQYLQFLGSDPSNYIVINQSTGAIVPFTNTTTRHITLSNGNKSLVMRADDLSSFTATIIAKVSVQNATNKNHFLKIKNLITGNTSGANIGGTNVLIYTNVDLNNGQTYVANDGVVSPGQSQLLYVSDVKRILKIIDSGSPSTPVDSSMLNNSAYDVTYNFALDNGQRDSYYGHASIKLIPGRPKVKGNLLVIYDYYQHTGGDGYFSVMSYLSPNSTSPESYGQIGIYTSTGGTSYNLRDSLDFRPTVKNAQAEFTFDYTTDPTFTNAGIYIPVNNSIFYQNYSYYLGRKDKLILSKDKNFQIIEGTPSVNPLLPVEPDGSLVIANLIHQPYTIYVPGEAPAATLPSLSVEKVQHRRWTMQDISDLQTRINNIEYYTALNNLEKNAQSLQVPDVNGLNRFKNGILVDDFSSFATSDSSNQDFNVSINRRTKQLTASQQVDNFPLQSSYLISNGGLLNSSSATSLGFNVNKVGQTNIFTLPYTTANLASQTLASNTININQFSTPISQGVVSLNPPMDNWVDNTKQPDLLVVDPDLQLYQSSNNLNLLSTGDWKVIPGTTTTSSTSVSRVNHGAFNGPFGTTVGYTQTTTQTYGSSSQTNTLGYYSSLGSTYNQNGGYITDISILPYIRPQQILFRSKGLSINTPMSTWFDGVNVNQYITNPDVIELTNVSGTFNEDDIIGYYVNNTFYPVATVAGVYNYPGTKNVRLYIVSNLHSSFESLSDLTSPTIQNGSFDSAGNYISSSVTATGTITSTNIINVHKSGFVSTVGDSFLDVNSNSVQYYRVYVNHGQFADAYGIWGSPRATGSLPAGTFNYTVPTSGTYTLRISTDDAQSGYVKINGVTKWTSSVQSGGYNDYALTLSSGTSNVAFSMTTSEDDGDAYFAAAIFDSTGNTIWDTTQLWSTAPTASGTMTTLPGGGFYFAGATQLSLSGLASSNTNFYVGSTIKVNTTFVSVDPLTRASRIIPSTYTTTVTGYTAATATVTVSPAVNISIGKNTYAGGDISSSYSIDGTYTNYLLALANGGLSNLCTDENGNFVGVLNIPATTFQTGSRVFRVDNRITSNNPSSATTYAEATFTASGLSTKSQAIDFSPSIDSAKNTFTQTNYRDTQLISTTVTYNPYDPTAQTFIIDKANYPNGAFLNSIKVFFATKPTSTNLPVTLSIVGTLNGYPNGSTLDNSIVTKYPNQINASLSPHHLDPNTYTEFVFDAPVYIQSGVLYAFILKSLSTEYNAWYAGQNQTAIPSSVKNLPSDITPPTITNIGTAPYVGSLFESQNAMTWSADQGKALMFVIERCKFNTLATPKLPFVVPQGLPYRKLTGQEIRQYYNANSVSNIFNVISGKDVITDAINLTTTDFIPSSTSVNYSYKSTVNNTKLITSEYSVTPGKFGCPTYDDIYLNDGNGERVLVANSNTSFFMYASMTSSDDTVSPIISDDGVSLYNIRWNINNMGLSNNTVTVVSGGTGYNVSTTVVTVSSPDDINGTQAYATANIVSGVIQSVNFISTGSGYLTTPTITITDPTTRSGNSDASIIIHGESDASGGNGIAKYFTKKVVLTPGNDSGDLRVFYTAYRPIGTNISVYYRILNRNDTQPFESGNWQLMTTLSNSQTYSQSRNDLYEFEAAPGVNNVADNLISYMSASGQTYTSFSQFAIKIVLSTSDNTNVPFLTDIRALALPSGTGL